MTCLGHMVAAIARKNFEDEGRLFIDEWNKQQKLGLETQAKKAAVWTGFG